MTTKTHLAEIKLSNFDAILAGLNEEQANRIWGLVREWAKQACDQDKAEVREKVSAIRFKLPKVGASQTAPGTKHLWHGEISEK